MDKHPIPEGITDYNINTKTNSGLSCANGLGSGDEIQMTSKNTRLNNFGFKNAVLPNMEGYPTNAPLGLPAGVSTVDNIYQTFPDPFSGGARLPRPYGPRDQLSLLSRFGPKKSKKSKKSKTVKKLKKSLKKYKRKYKSLKKSLKKCQLKIGRRFGSGLSGLSGLNPPTPGTQQWTSELGSKDFSGQTQARPYFSEATGNVSPKFNYFESGIKPEVYSDLNQVWNISNVPMQYSDNSANTPLFFGRNKRRKFGAMSTTGDMTGPNNVGYNPPIPMYHAGGTTYDFKTQQLYSPIGMVGGPTNSTGPFASMGTNPDPVLGVLPDGSTPDAYLTNTNILNASSGINNAYSYTYNGLKFGRKKKSLNRFGNHSPEQNLLYTPELVTSGVGPLTLYQPAPPYISEAKNLVPEKGYVSFGKKKSEQKKIEKKIEKKPEQKPEQKPDKLKTRFGGATITSTPDGKVIVS